MIQVLLALLVYRAITGIKWKVVLFHLGSMMTDLQPWYSFGMSWGGDFGIWRKKGDKKLIVIVKMSSISKYFK